MAKEKKPVPNELHEKNEEEQQQEIYLVPILCI